MPLLNILESDFRLPSKVCILAPGPRGRPHYAEIPDDYLVIALSKAVLIPEVKADIWVMNHAHQDWFETAYASFEGMRVFRDEAILEAQAVLGEELTCYSFHALRGALGLMVFKPVDGVIRSGGSVSGVALQLAYNFGAREILLCGVDLSGDGYFDGTVNVQPSGERRGETWDVVSNLNPLIRWMVEERGIMIATLSPTQLDVPDYPPPGSKLLIRAYDGLQEPI